MKKKFDPQDPFPPHPPEPKFLDPAGFDIESGYIRFRHEWNYTPELKDAYEAGARDVENYVIGEDE